MPYLQGPHCCAATAGARWGDLMRSEMAFVDYDDTGHPAFLETRTGRHKTMAAQMHRHQFLPMVAPVRGVNGKDWATPWIELRRSKGLTFPPEGLVMPAPDQHGQATGKAARIRRVWKVVAEVAGRCAHVRKL